MKFHSSLIGCVAAIATISISAVRAQSPPFPPVPAPTVAPSPPQEDGPTAIITFADETQIKAQASSSGRFQLVGLHPREVINIAFDVPVSPVSNPVTAQPLDGGKIIGPPKDVGQGAKASLIRFQVGDQPGLYRVLIMGLSSRATLQFWVTDAKNPKNNRPVLNPSH